MWSAIFTERGYLNTILQDLGIGDPDFPHIWLDPTDQKTLLATIVVAEIWRSTALIMIILLAGLQGIPREFGEAAEVFGAGWWQRLWRVTLPMLKPSIQVALLLRVILAFEVFATVIAIAGEGTTVLSAEAYRWENTNQNENVAAAYATLILVLSVVFGAIRAPPLRTTQGAAPPMRSSLRIGTRSQPCGTGRDPARALGAPTDLLHHARGLLDARAAVYAYPKQLLAARRVDRTMDFFLHSEGIVPSLQRSIERRSLTLVIALGLGIPAGYALARFAFRGADTFRLSVVGTRAFPIVILSIPLAVIFLRWGIDDTVYGVAIAHAALALPVRRARHVERLRRHLRRVGGGRDDARLQSRCRRRHGSSCRSRCPGLAAAAIFVFIISWNEVFAAAILTLRERTLPAQILSVLNASPLPFKFAGGFFLLAPSLIVIFVIRKYLFNMWGRVVK